MQSHTILIVEDDLALAEAIQLKLDREGFQVVTMVAAEAAIAWLEKNIPDYIWLDVLLPGMSGIDFLEYLRAHEKFKNTPVLIVSVSTGPEKLKRAFELNIVDYITKSDHDIKDIVAQVSAHFTRSLDKAKVSAL